jgi:hypothetical protein
MTKFIKSVSTAVLFSFASTFVIAPAHAALIGTEQAASVRVDRSELKSYFDRQHISDAIRAEGVTPEMAKARVDAMTDSEAARLAEHIQTEPAGAGIIGVLFTVFIVLLVTDILGLTKVYPFTRSVR